MGFYKGRLTVRRYRVIDPVPDGFRDSFEAALTEQAFRDTAALSRGEEAVGWVCQDNIMDTEFSDRLKLIAFCIVALIACSLCTSQLRTLAAEAVQRSAPPGQPHR